MKKKVKVDNIDCYKNLGMAVLRRACIDYINALRTLEKNPNNFDAENMKFEVEFFFHHDLGFYADVHPDYLIYGLRDLVKSGRRFKDPD